MSLGLNTTNNIFKFLKEGKVLEGISIGDKKSIVFRILGNPDKLLGDELSGFIEFKSGVRFRYIEDVIDDLSLQLLDNKKAKYPIHVESLPEIKNVSKKMLISEFILLLAHKKISWRSWDEHSINWFTIRTEGDVLVLFNLKTSKLERIIYLGKNLIRIN